MVLTDRAIHLARIHHTALVRANEDRGVTVIRWGALAPVSREILAAAFQQLLDSEELS